MSSDMTTDIPPVCKFVTQSSGDHSDRRQYQLAYLWFSGYFGLYGTYFYMGYHGINADVLSSMKETLNYLTPLTGVVLGYFYTASIGGRRKDETITSLVGASKNG